MEAYDAIRAILPRGAIIEYEPEKLKYVIQYEYKPDFVVTLKDGRKIYIETKGAGRQFDDAVRRKMVAVKEQHPDKDIRIIFYRDADFGRRKKNGLKTRQSDWASKVGFPFTIREYKEEWFS
jgi:hypothetical protein